MGLLGKLYKFIWSHIGGRPWTYIIRDFCYQNPLFFILVFLFTLLWFLHVPDRILFVFLGILLGHLFWGTQYKKGQQNSKRTTLQRWIGRGIG